MLENGYFQCVRACVRACVCVWLANTYTYTHTHTHLFVTSLITNIKCIWSNLN